MPLVRPPQARNSIKKALYGLLDKPIKRPEVDKLWEYFKFKCAYCGAVLDKSRREGHADHLVSVTLGGNNSLSNFVLACGKCNGDYKRDMDWEPFLAQRSPDPKVRDERRQKILSWVELHKEGIPHRDPILVELVESQVAKVLEQFNQAVNDVRAARKPHNPAGRVDGNCKQRGSRRSPAR